MAQGDTLPHPQAGPPAAGPRPPVAWQPLTPGGVAAFAHGSLTRLFLIESVVAGLFAAVLIWFLYLTCLPVLHEAVRQLPEEGRVENQILRMPHQKPMLLAESRFLAAAIDLQDESRAGLTSDFLLELHAVDFQICSLLGCLVFPYPKNWIIEINRKEIEPWWSAWQPVLLSVLTLGVILSLVTVWTLLATVYWPIPWFIAYYSDRKLNLAGAWRVASASLMPGAFVMMLALILYALGILDLIQTAILMALHLVAGWIYLAASPFTLPRITDSQTPEMKENPFTPPPPEPPDPPEPSASSQPAPPKNPNPFAAPPPAADNVTAKPSTPPRIIEDGRSD